MACADLLSIGLVFAAGAIFGASIGLFLGVVLAVKP